MKIWLFRLNCLFVSGLIFCSSSITAEAKNAVISLFASDGLTLLAESRNELNFNAKASVISAGTQVEMGIADPAAAIVSLEGSPGREVSITIDALPEFSLDGTHPIPFEVRVAYSESNPFSGTPARNVARELPAGHNTLHVRLPDKSDASTDQGLAGNRSKIYLFIYGTLGPVPPCAPPGNYSGSIRIFAGYSNF